MLYLILYMFSSLLVYNAVGIVLKPKEKPRHLGMRG